MADVHVVPDGDRWKVEHDGKDVDSFSTQSEAIDAGKSVADAAECELVIHGQDGRIRAKDSHGNDPRNVSG